MAQPFVNFVSQLDYGDIPHSIRQIMRRSLLDTIGVAMIGTTTPMSAIARDYAEQFWGASSDNPGARILADGRRVAPAGAALAGAFTIDSIDAHDGSTPAKGHAGSAVLPAMMAVFEERQQAGIELSGQDLMLAMALAYEIGYRTALAHHGTLDDYHTSGAWNAVGTAATAARFLGLGTDGIRHAAGIAEYHGPRSQMMRCIDHPTMLRDGVGWGAPTGVSAAYMAAMGFTGAPALTVEGKEARPFWSDLGDRWETENTHHKLYPVCRWAHPALDAIQELMADNELHHTDIRSIRIQTFRYAVQLAGAAPGTLDELSYAIIYPAAIMAVRGEIGRSELQESVLADPNIHRIAAVTELVETDHYTAISVGKRWADVTLELNDGRHIASDPKTPRGDPDDPLTDAEISAKFHGFTRELIDPDRARAIEQACRQFDALDSNDLQAFFDLVLAPVDAPTQAATP